MNTNKMTIFLLDTDEKQSLELTHRGRKMEISYRNNKHHGHDTVCGIISWTKNGYHEFQGFHVGRYGNEQRLYIAFDTPVEFSKVMRKEVGLKLEKIIIEGVEKS